MNNNNAGFQDNAAIDAFAAALKYKMAASRAKGRSGWNDPLLCGDDLLRNLLAASVAKGDPIDVGNFAMMLFTRQARASIDGGEILQAYSQAHMYRGALRAAQAGGYESLTDALADLARIRNEAENKSLGQKIDEQIRAVEQMRDKRADRRVANVAVEFDRRASAEDRRHSVRRVEARRAPDRQSFANQAAYDKAYDKWSENQR
ncbi:MAG TPA: hypothetical protein VF681_11425 [Abditibacteriaceae bacterium]